MQRAVLSTPSFRTIRLRGSDNPRSLLRLSTSQGHARHYRQVRVSAKGDLKEKLGPVAGVVDVGLKMADGIAGVLPESIPRPVAKAAVFGGLALVAWWLLQKVLSFVLFLGVVGGGLYLWYRISDNSGDDGKGGGGRSDALSEAQKIMDKYK